MDHDAQSAQSSGYESDNWVTISPYSQSPYANSPMNEYSGFGFMPHGLPSDSIQRMPPPGMAPHPSHHQPHQLIQPAPPSIAPHQLPILRTTWPSQLTNPTPTTSAGGYSAVSMPMTPVSGGAPPTFVPLSSTAPLATSSNGKSGEGLKMVKSLKIIEKIPRKTLSAEQKQAMCQYHDENPGVRQADIGAKFGVERSTVSKVLRYRNQHLKREQEAANAFKRGKTRQTDFDRTLSSYIRRQRKRGLDITDDEIMEQAKLYARAGGYHESLLGTLTSGWLQKFKQKHKVGLGRPLRRASGTHIPDSARLSTTLPTLIKSATHSVVAPASPTQPISPLSGDRSDEDLHKETLEFELTYSAQASQSNNELSGDMRDCCATFSAGTVSPAASFHFSPNPATGDTFAVDNSLQLHVADGSHFHHRERRSHTFPSIDVNFLNQEQPVAEEPR
ncbi:hypothetical protein RJ55_03003 [Drechmeria coniospora]|nr:hypothetical protein RJ55_03003 [Drechmeria coniospora]